MSKKIIQGTVVSDKADKTLVVSVSSRSKTRYKGKTIKRLDRYIVHDPMNKAKEGDLVEITESKPISKTKKWRLLKIDVVGENFSDSLIIDSKGDLK
jgi:small subunit ribosomal protein S17